MINGYTRTCGLIGNPVEHTLSPVIHNFLAEAMEENLIYVPLHVPEGFVKEAVVGAFALNILGCNVTVPYKSEIMPFLSEIDPLAAKIGAVNTLVRTSKGFKGYNTDMPGLFRAMTADGVTIKGEQVIILGAGGVARAVAVLLAEKGAKRIIILNRTVEKAQIIAEEVNQLFGFPLVEVMPLSDYRKLKEEGPYLAIQATSVGMHPNIEEVLIKEKDFYEMVHTGYDLIFNPSSTTFMKLTMEHGGSAFNGAKMLLFQGIIAYEYWVDKSVSEELTEQAYKKLLISMKGE